MLSLMIKTIYNDNLDELNRAGVDVIAAEINKILEQQKQVVVAIPGGRSVVGIWDIIAGKKDIPWNKVHIFMADERIDVQYSNYRLAFSFLKKLVEAKKLPAQNIHPFKPEDSKYKGSVNYYNELKIFGGKPDLLILGVGEDGHVGALYPNHHSIRNDAEGYITMMDSPKPPPGRVSLSRKTMLSAKAAILLFFGEEKRNAYRNFRTGNDIVSCPARLAKRIDNVYVLTNLD